jgi:hypothetical protein
MGRSYTPVYRLEFYEGRPEKGCMVQAWKGKATTQALEQWVFSYSKSLELGGVNQHISLSLGHIPYPNKARIVRQSNGEVVAEWKAGLFQVY